MMINSFEQENTERKLQEEKAERRKKQKEALAKSSPRSKFLWYMLYVWYLNAVSYNIFLIEFYMGAKLQSVLPILFCLGLK